MKLVAVVYYPNEQRLEAVIEEAPGKRRRIPYKWFSKDQTPLPPTWLQAVFAEVGYQQTEEYKKSTGRSGT